MKVHNAIDRERARRARGADLPLWLTCLLCSAILLLGACLRFIDLERVPPGLNVDEALHAYEAYAILETGHDQWGHPWPITFRAFNDYRRPATIYSAVPFIAVFGLNVFAIRAMAAFWGWLTLVLTYRLAADLFGRRVGLVAALVLALSSWHVGFSRLGVEASGPLLATLVLALDLGWRWYRSRRPVFLAAASAVFGLSLYTYTITQALTPLLVVAMGLIFLKRLLEHPRVALLAGLVLIVTALPLAATIAATEVTWNRFDAISVLSGPGGVRLALRQWLGHFSPRYLFFSGDASPIHHIQGYGQLYWIELLLVPLGTVGLILHRADPKAKWLLLAWLLLSPVPAALTRQDMGSPNSMRALSGVVPWAIFSAQGLATAGRWLPPRRRLKVTRRAGLAGVMLGSALASSVLAGGLMWNAAHVLHAYFTRYPVEAARAFEYGIGEAMDYVLDPGRSGTGPVVLTDWISQPHIFAVFYAKQDPREFQAKHAPYGQRLSEKLEAWGETYSMGNVDQLYTDLEHAIFIARPHMLPGIKPSFVILHPDGSPAFIVVEK
jgi:4-amino-4-deoxy-L-arabinose transferase-like glycosyltransferase